MKADASIKGLLMVITIFVGIVAIDKVFIEDNEQIASADPGVWHLKNGKIRTCSFEFVDEAPINLKELKAIAPVCSGWSK
jgi:hypothetical protein